MDTKQYTGKVVIAERANPTKEQSSYYDGQYLIYAETDSQLYGHRIDGSHGGFSVYGLGGSTGPTSLPLAGEAAYRIAAVDNVEPWMLDALDRADETIRAVQAGEQKAGWVMHVYEAAQGQSEALRRLISKALASDDADANATALDMCEASGFQSQPTVQITVPYGVHVNVSHA